MVEAGVMFVVAAAVWQEYLVCIRIPLPLALQARSRKERYHCRQDQGDS